MSTVQPAETPGPDERPGVRGYLERTQGAEWLRLARAHPDVSGALAFGLLAALVYLATGSRDRQELDYYVRLADAFLHGRYALTEAPSWLNELIPAAPGEWYVPYPPMPAVVLMPFVAVFGVGLYPQVISSLVGAIGVALVWIALGRFGLPIRTRALLTAVFGFGTVFWYVTEVGNAWYFAHVCAIGLGLLALIAALDRRLPFVVGLLLGAAALSRLPMGLAAPFYLAALLGFPARRADLHWPIVTRVAVAFGLGLAVPAVAYAAYNLARWGTVIDLGYVRIPGVLEDPVYAEHGILSIAYIPRNLYAIFFRSWNYVDDPPWLQPSWWGLSIVLTTPLYLWLAKARLRDPRVAWAALATVLVAIPIITHGNVGISQFGYRFSLDFQILLFVILGTVLVRGVSWRVTAAAIASIVFCAYAIWAIGIGFVAY